MKHHSTNDPESLIAAAELLSYANNVVENPVGHLDLLEQAVLSLLFIHPPVLMKTTDGDPVLVGDPEMTVGLLKLLPPDTLISVRWWPAKEPIFHIKTRYLLKTTLYSERHRYLRSLLPSLIKSWKRNKDVARAIQAHPSQISRSRVHD